MSRYFWKDWNPEFRIIYWILLLLAFLSVIFFGYTYFYGYDLIIDWKSVAYFEPINLLLDKISVYPFTIDVQSDSLVILQRFYASPLEINLILNYIILGIAFLFFAILLAISSYLSRIWFLISIGIWVALLSIFRVDMLLLFNQPDYTGILIFGGLSILLSYYFNQFNKNISFTFRIILFVALFGISFIIIALFAEQQLPFVFLTSHIIIPLLLITIIFTFLVAHESVAAFVYIISDTAGGNKNHVHFLILTAIYLVNLVMLYLYHINLIDWDIYYFNPYLLLFISSILGIWGYKQREQQYQYLFPFYPLGSYFYLSMMLIAYATIGFFYGTGNDPAFEVIEEAIIYGHLGYGFMFFVYIVANFIGPLGGGLKLHKILYKPGRMPFFIYRFAGLIAVFALAIGGNKDVPLFYSYGTFYNQQGDYAELTESSRMKEAYYQQSRIYARLNHHANYALAEHYNERKAFGKASVSYLNALNGKPFPYAYVNLARLYEENNRFFDALFTLQEGVNQVESGPIYNNLALLYSKTDIIDSTFYFLDKALQHDEANEQAIANIEAFAAVNDLGSFIDSMDIEENEEDIKMLNNKIVRFNKQQKYYGAIPELLKDTDEDNFFGSGLAFNYLINTIYKEDTTDIKATIQLSEKFLNTVYNESIRFGQSATDYYHFYVADAFRRLNLLANESNSGSAKYFKTLGLWALEQGAPDQAANFFNMARNSRASNVAWLEAFSHILNNDTDNALQVIQDSPGDTINTFIIREMATASSEGTDQEKMFYIQYHLPYYDTISFKNIASTISNQDLRAEAIISFSKKLYNNDLTEEAIQAFSLLADLQLTKKSLFGEIMDFELKLFAAQGRLLELANYINDNNIEFPFSKFPQKVFYTGLLNAISGDSINALQNLRWMAKNSPFNEMEVVKATDYIREYSDDSYEAYNLILNALELNPGSVRLLKAYILEATRLGLDGFAENSLQELKEKIPVSHYNEFLMVVENNRPTDTIN